jgi:hypothetical protein
VSRLVLAHRLAYEFTHGPIDDPSTKVLHRCDNPPCCNPDHLFLGTQAANVLDARAKGRLARQAGARNPAAKVTAPRVAEIRAQHARGVQRSELARVHGLCWTSINNIIQGRTWRDEAIA